MNYKLQKIKKLKAILVFSLVLIFTNCQDISESNDEVKSGIQTVSSIEAKKFLSSTSNSTFSKSLKNVLDNLELDKMTHEELKGSDQFLAVIPFSTNNETQYERVLLTKVNNEIIGVVFSMYLDDVSSKEKFSGRIIINSLEGEFKNGYRAVDGVIVSQFVKSDLSEKYNSKKAIVLDVFNAQSIDLDEVSIMNNYHGIKMANEFSWTSIYGSSGNYNSNISWNSGGSTGFTSPLPLSVVANPCDKIKEQMTNALFNSKQEELSKKTNLKVETGYSQSKNGPFTALTSAGSTSGLDKMNINVAADVIGYIHTHLNDYETGKINADGSPEVRGAIRMFSPADVGIFLALVKNAETNNIPVNNIYGAMVSSDGTYQLRFTGDVSQIAANFNWNAKSLEDAYKTYLEKGNKELNFLRFLEEKCNMKGIELYKMNKDKTSTKKVLDTNKKLIDINC